MAEAPRGGWSDRHDELARQEGHSSWAAWVEAIEEERGHEICGAKNRRDSPCTRYYANGNPRGRCSTHGGRSPVEAPDRETTGRYGKRLRDAARQVYLTEREDPASLGNRDEIAVATVRIGDLLDRLEEVADEDEESEIWEEVREWLEQRAELVDNERKLLEARHRAVPTDRVRAIVNYIGKSALRAIERHVDDDADRAECLREVRAALDRLERGAVGPREDPARASPGKGRALPEGA